MKLVADLAAAGLLFREVVPISDRLIPVAVAGCMGYLRPEDGRTGVLIGHDEPELCARINAEWERLAVERGLLSGEGEFLVGLDLSGADPNEADPVELERRWVRVELAPVWDVAGAGCERGVLGVGAGNPAFVMASLDGEVLMHGGYYQAGISLTAVAHPRHIAALREQARRLVSSEYLASDQRRWTERWLTPPA